MSAHKTLTMRVQAMRYEARGIVSLELQDPDGATLPEYGPGAHIDLHLGNGLVRSYSLCGAPEVRDRYTVGVLQDRNSRGGSRYVHEQLRVGAKLTVSAPRNNFELDESAAHTVLVAGGIGVTPIVCMARRLAELGRSFTLLYCARTRAEAAFVESLSAYGDAVRFHFDDEAGAPPDMNAMLAGQDAQTHLYCCGPGPMLNAFEAACEAHGYPNVHIERFAADPSTESVQEGEYVVQLSRTGSLVKVPSGKSLLDALLEAGLDVEHSCREGVCGSCETAVLEGCPDHRDSVLSNSERASNKTMMVCVSGCKGSRLVLDL
ncbi:PDR/VanB family oxidoreductase [Cupriavidus pinatubonensis]|uniref:Phenoxybenzoate dioxygenase subunit beta n=1 Tax=Cupriavidus pinatubonensis TaxID=248026 RepID=A0ABN7ZM41_9BURK|nr:PDR/VanB family oxidoreductase [Cupriavidus pinatubonensis]CAG9185766.1 Phenoxybenzoate dioxygenase subunit beta [Cupriavidus pinatubonensis]